MSSTTLSSSNFRLILDALDDYTNQTGADLTQNPFADKPHSCPTSDAVLELLNDRAKQFKEYREGNRKLINWLSPIVKVVHAFSDILREVVSSLPFQPAKVIFVGVDVLLAAASSVSASYDTLVDLFECIGSFLKRLNIYTKIPFPSPMIDIIVKIMVEVLAVLALATTQIKNGRLKKFAKKLLGEGDIEAVLQRLDRLTQEEARMTVAQTLEVVHGLVNNVKVVMDGAQAFLQHRF
ncbi:hypothetical protein B0F90DRAFT_1760133 [Multifurca ochricompacta]|uniref:Fungal STAND N-terminal Goodbye domain-containing protein n=1 Tax=Multifurca ochricompacta TaxID=376703 RepID=A0AAD4LXW2_9AGAM|nr:hypothetical protein B0F90DRAFT_1760133 [Multifurca ochricompacta]